MAVVGDFEAEAVLAVGGAEPAVAQVTGKGRGLLQGIEDDEATIDGSGPRGNAATSIGDAEAQQRSDCRGLQADGVDGRRLVVVSQLVLPTEVAYAAGDPAIVVVGTQEAPLLVGEEEL